MNKMHLTTLFAAAAYLAAMLCAAAEYPLPQLPDGVMPNTEVSTNLPLHVSADRLREFALTLNASNCASNEVLVAIGCDADGICIAVVFYGMLLLKPLGCGFERLKRLPRELQVVFLVLAIVAAVEADKPNSPTRAFMRHLVGIPEVVTQEDISRGYRLDHVTNDLDHSNAMPTNAVCLGNAHIRGAASAYGRNLLDFGGWSFPFGSNDVSYSSIWWFHDGRIRMKPHDHSGEIATGVGDILAVQGESCIWWAPGDGDERIVGWWNVFQNANTNESVDLQIVLRHCGDFETWSNSVAHIYKRIDPNDWDGDGLDNLIDPEPAAYGGECFGTGVDWLNANCGAVLSASPGIDGEPVVAWHTNVCAAAYYWLEFSVLSDATRIKIDCEEESSLGDMVVIANSNQVCQVPLLMGPRYHVAANGPLAGVAASDANAEITVCSPLRSGGGASGIVVVTASTTLSTNMWDYADDKVRRLWPNTLPADNHADFSPSFDFNLNFCSPGVAEGRIR